MSIRYAVCLIYKKTSEVNFQNPKRQLRSQVQEYFTYRN